MIIKPHYSLTSEEQQDGERLVVVKSTRNDLAHGTKSFKECGQEYTMSEITGIKTEIVTYLAEILQNIDAFVTSKAYLNSPSTT